MTPAVAIAQTKVISFNLNGLSKRSQIMAFLPGTGSYHDARGFGVSEALKRARSPHKMSNLWIGLGLTAFIASVCTIAGI